MLNPVECMEEAPAVMLARTTSESRPNAVWVRGKNQAPYRFFFCLDPCSPHEWPYDLQALRGTEDYDDILAWYFARYRAVSRGEIDDLLDLLLRCVGERQISVSIYHDIDTQDRHLCFTAWEFPSEAVGETSAGMLAFNEQWLATASLDDTVFEVSIWTAHGRYEDRNGPRGG